MLVARRVASISLLRFAQMQLISQVRKKARRGETLVAGRAAGRALHGCALSSLGMALVLAGCSPAPRDESWSVYGGDEGGQRFSTLSQINTANVSQLQVAWQFDAGEEGGLQASPLVAGQRLFGYTTTQAVFALNAGTGKLIWRFTPDTTSGQPARGMTYWRDGADDRLFVTNVNFLYALDPATGKPIKGFGAGGKIDLRQGLGRDPQQVAVFLTTPGVIYKDLIIVGFRTAENAPAAPGDIRAYDVRTGRLRWSFHTIPHEGEAGSESWPANAWKTAGGVNNWAGMAVDSKRGIVFVPTGSPVFDFYGGDRPGDNLFANSLIALDAATGRRLWHFQAVHHDLWDRDFPSPPTLLTVNHGGRKIDAVAQPSKQGFVFLFDRATGKPLFEIEERAVPASTVPGERASPTQPFPLKPAPFARQHLTEALLTTRTPAAQAAVLAQFRGMQSDGQFVPLNLSRPTVIFPGFDGGAEWGGAAADPQRGILYVNSSDVPWFTKLVPNIARPGAGQGASIYQANCAACHGPERTGSPPDIPSLVGVGSRMFDYELGMTIMRGKGRMPGFPQLSGDDRNALIPYLMSDGKTDAASAAGDRKEVMSTGKAAAKSPYTVAGYNKFVDPDGYPAVKPPWGTLNAIDMNTGEYLWKVPLGEYPELAAKGLKNTGSENYGGPIVTAGRLVFIGATIYDRKFRAFDSQSGKLLWEQKLPFAGTASPVTYSVGGRQFVVIATSGARDHKGPQGARYMAFALPK